MPARRKRPLSRSNGASEDYAPRHVRVMQALAEGLDIAFNGEGPREIGFVLMVYPMVDDGACSFISNGTGPEELIATLKTVLDGFDGV